MTDTPKSDPDPQADTEQDAPAVTQSPQPPAQSPESPGDPRSPEDAAQSPEDTESPEDTAPTPEWNAYPGGDAFPGYPDDQADAPPAPPEAIELADGTTSCPGCHNPIERWASYCEACGQTLTPTAPMPMAPTALAATPTGAELPADSVATRPSGHAQPAEPKHPCAECGGPIGADLYCEHCGAKAPNVRDHFREAPASWVAGVCDRGIRHSRNEDAMALAAEQEPGSHALLVVCDGVSNAQDSHIASLAAARAARGVLTSRGVLDEATTGADQTAALQDSIVEAAQQANTAVVDKTEADATNPPSCTFAVAIIDRGTVVYGNLGDSRVYWIDDNPDQSRLLSVDDSVAQARIAMGVDRETAENGPQAHAITKWIGRDAPDLEPTMGSLELPGTGWVLVCSDGLWNYASTAGELSALVSEAITRNPGNQRVRSLAVSLVRWARKQGGRDNITVALARIGEFATPDTDATVLTSPPV